MVSLRLLYEVNAMSKNQCSSSPNRLGSPSHRLSHRNQGQTIVEFTLLFVLLVIVAWIPADFGLAFYTGQIAQNAVREGARIAAADTNLPAAVAVTSCTMPGCYTAGNIYNETAARLPAALLSTATINVEYPAPGSAGCNQLVRVSVTGQYPYFFYQVLRFVGVTVATPPIQRSTSMRWEHQTPCNPF
jgi:Flp pilus assembly protein TadG